MSLTDDIFDIDTILEKFPAERRTFNRIIQVFNAMEEEISRLRSERDLFYQTMVDLRENNAKLSAVVEAVQNGTREPRSIGVKILYFTPGAYDELKRTLDGLGGE